MRAAFFVTRSRWRLTQSRRSPQRIPQNHCILPSNVGPRSRIRELSSRSQSVPEGLRASHRTKAPFIYAVLHDFPSRSKNGRNGGRWRLCGSRARVRTTGRLPSATWEPAYDPSKGAWASREDEKMRTLRRGRGETIHLEVFRWARTVVPGSVRGFSVNDQSMRSRRTVTGQLETPSSYAFTQTVKLHNVRP
jgi:hypothetical protein